MGLNNTLDRVQDTLTNDGLSREEIQSLYDFLKKYAHVVQAIQNGAGPTQAKTETGVSRSTVYNVIRCMIIARMDVPYQKTKA